MSAVEAACRRLEDFGVADATPDHPEVVLLLETWEETRDEVRSLFGPDPQFVHFTSPADAARIAASCQLELSRMIVDAVFAVVVGAKYVPKVQRGADGGFGAVDGLRTSAVVFRCDEMPDTAFCEEVVWHRTSPLPIRDVTVMDADEAARLLDSSVPLPEHWL